LVALRENSSGSLASSGSSSRQTPDVVRELDHVGDHEAGVEAGLGGQETRLLDAPLREVDPG
jgi:hypothetical protein